MSQGQLRRPNSEQEAVKYGDAFYVSGELAYKPIGPQDAVTRNYGVTITETDVAGRSIDVTEAVVVLAQYPQGRSPAVVTDPDAVTIGEALEAAAISARNRPVNQSDAAAIQAAEVRATGSNQISPGGVGTTAQSAATLNVRTSDVGDQTKLAEVLGDATEKLPSDKVARRGDAGGMTVAEARNNPRTAVRQGGVADAVSAAARLNMK